jgi:hypothetical protein
VTAFFEMRGHSRIYQCDGCGKTAGWEDGWMSYGSVALEEICPHDMPTVCSKKCRAILDSKLKAGTIELPKISLQQQKLVKQRKGY